MGKAQGLFGNFSGKIGNLVGFAIKNASNNQVQGVRAYQPTVSNPKSEPQAIQRMKMTAAVNFYRQLTEVLNNAWQGQKYGTKSRNYFMSLAMSQAEGIPFVDKGDKHFYPGQYPVSQGSLPTQAVTAISGAAATTTLNVGTDFTASGASWADFSQALINNTFGVQNGDKITFIGVGQRNGEFAPMYSYVIVNTDSTMSLEDVVSGSNMTITVASGGYVQLGFSQLEAEVAAAVIVSRYPQTAGGSWLRSSSTMFCAASFVSEYMGAARYAAAIATYQKSESSATSDWYLNQGLTPGAADADWGGSDSNLSIVGQGATLQNVTGLELSDNSTGSATIGTAEMSDGTLRVPVVTDSTFGLVVASSYFGSNSTAYVTQDRLVLANAANLALFKAANTNVKGYTTSLASGDYASTPEVRP